MENGDNTINKVDKVKEALVKELEGLNEEGYFNGLKISKTLWFLEYADFAAEFPEVFD